MKAKGKVKSGNGKVRTSGFPLSLFPSPIYTSPLGIGLVGLGRWGANYLKTLQALPECRLVACADADAAVRARATRDTGIPVRKTVDELLSDPEVAAVVVATPDGTHFRLAAAALNAGRDVLVEKPMSLAASEAESLVSLAESGRRVFAVGHTAVYATDIESLRAELAALQPSAALHAAAERTSSGPSAARQSPVVTRHSSLLYDLCPHDIALAVLLFGAPAAARAQATGSAVEYEVRFTIGTLLSGRAEWRKPPHVRRFQVAGKGRTAQGATCPVSRASESEVRQTPLGRQCLDFIDCCHTRRQPLSNGRLGLAVAHCLAALSESSAARGRWVSIGEEAQLPDAKRFLEDSGLRRSAFGVRT